MSLKNPVTPSGIDSATFRLVAQPLNHYATPGPLTQPLLYEKYKYKIIDSATCFDFFLSHLQAAIQRAFFDIQLAMSLNYEISFTLKYEIQKM